MTRPTAATPLLPALSRVLDEQPDLTLTLARTPFTVAELEAASRRLAGFLADRVAPGDRVVILARNGRPALLAWWATTLCGGFAVPLNTSNRGPVLAHQVLDAGPVAMIVEDEFVPVLDDALVGTGLRVPVLVGGPGAGRPSPGPVPAWATEVIDFDAAVSGGPAVTTTPDLDAYATSHLIYTAGTTGPSKACMVSHGFVANMARQMHENLERHSGDVLWSAMPLFHMAAVGHVMGSLQLGSAMDVAQRFSVSGFWDEILRSRATMAALMGSMLPMIVGAPESEAARRAFGQLRVVSGSPVTADLAARWTERFGVERVGSGAYGLTEASLITLTPPGGYRAGAAGKVNESFEVRIVDEHDNPLPVGEVGEIVARPTRPAIMFNGYWRQPEKTLEVFRGLWFHCGDYGRLDEDGYLYFVDRGKDYLRRGGENISSFEIEGIVAAHPAVGEVAVHAVPSPLAEDDLKVTVVPAPGARIDPAELFEWLHPRIPRYAVPSHIEVRTELPKNAVGRVLKRVLRDEGVTPRTWSTDPRAVTGTRVPAGAGEQA
ncbi:AMP-binding protein [Micromonospora sp. NPDC023956]|uniref:AMP-binding protein n=1 Tax=Micromonospora sp. NPDC023956 TaxID=3155722 RepID=UPI0033FB1616